MEIVKSTEKITAEAVIFEGGMLGIMLKIPAEHLSEGARLRRQRIEITDGETVILITVNKL
jgi:hypothetical protein